jgi:UDP-3-O-[3-hydroxymyristoyl] glucosamine N-acyltransferase
MIKEYVHIEADCFIGGFTILEDEAKVYMKVMMLDRVKVRKGTTIGAVSLVIRNVKENTTVSESLVKVFKE